MSSEEEGGGEVDNVAAGGHFARMGEHGERNRGAHAGIQLGSRSVGGGE